MEIINTDPILALQSCARWLLKNHQSHTPEFAAACAALASAGYGLHGPLKQPLQIAHMGKQLTLLRDIQHGYAMGASGMEAGIIDRYQQLDLDALIGLLEIFELGVNPKATGITIDELWSKLDEYTQGLPDHDQVVLGRFWNWLKGSA